MKEFWNTIQLIFTAIGGWLGYFLGGCDGLLYALIAFVVVDYITGVMCLFLYLQRGREPPGERRTPWLAHPGEAEGYPGTAP